jgi:hypothetical protein
VQGGRMPLRSRPPSLTFGMPDTELTHQNAQGG